MQEKTKTRFKYAISISIFVLIMAFSSVALFQEWQRQKEFSILDGNLRLKAPKEDIITYNEDPVTGKITYTYLTKKEVPAGTYNNYQEDLSKRTTSSQQFVVSKNEKEEKYVGKFYSGAQFAQKDGKWFKIETATTTKSAFVQQTKLTLLDKVQEFFGQTVLADSISPNSGAGDGVVFYDSLMADGWDNTHDASEGVSSDDSSTTASISTACDGYCDTDSWASIGRVFLPFNTSDLSSTATISSASLSVYITSIVTSNGGTPDSNNFFNLVQTAQNSNTALAVGDFDTCGAIDSPTTGADNTLYSGITTPTTVTVDLNTTGKGWIKKTGQASNCGVAGGLTGWTCLGLRDGHDINDTPPDYGSGDDSTSMTINTSNASSNKPVLTVTYTTPPANPALKINGGTTTINGGTLEVDGRPD